MGNEINGGVFFGAVIQGRTVNVNLPQVITPALAGLPPVSAVFTGRDKEISDLLQVLEPGSPRTMSAAVVAGLGGIGKTELVVQAAMCALRREDWFPGGVLFVDMLGYDPERRLSPERALDGFLRALGIPSEVIPTDLQDRSRLYRSALAALADAGRRILVVLDNVSSADQSRPLLPTDGVTATVLTSRDTLDLGARLFDLDVVDQKAAIGMLEGVVCEARGPRDTRVRDSPADAAAIARSCAGLPLALRIAAALLADNPARPLSSLAQALTAQHVRLNRLRRQERAVRGAFDLSYQRLDPVHARLFRLLSLNAGPDISTEAVARLADTDQHEAEELLQDLARTHLIEPGRTWGRWRLHDLVRLYAEENGKVHAVPDDREDAQTRLHRHYFHTCVMAVSRRGRFFRAGRAFRVKGASTRFTSPGEAMAWLEAEHVNLVATTTAARQLGPRGVSVPLAWAVGQYLTSRWHFDDLITITRTVLAISHDPDGSTVRSARVLALLGRDLEHHGSHERRDMLRDAFDAQTRALAIYREHSDRGGEAWTLVNHSRTLHAGKRIAEAYEALDQAEAIFHALDDQQGMAEVRWVSSCLSSR